MRQSISNGWRRAVWGLAGLALLAFTPAVGAQGGGGGSGFGGGGGGGAAGVSGGTGMSSLGSSGSGASGVSGTGLSGGSATFSGGQALLGGLGNTSPTGSGASTYFPNQGGSIGQTGIMGNYYSNPFALGLQYSGMTQSTFGQPMYNLQSLASSGTGTVGGLGTTAGRVGGASYSGGAGASGSRVGGAGVSGGASGSRVGGVGASGGRAGGVGYGSTSFGASGGLGGMSMGTGATAPMASTYSTRIAFDAPRPQPTAVRTDIQGVIARSVRLPSRANIQVMTDGTAVVLRGTVASEHERDVAELTAKLTPGVVVRNELQVKAPPGATARVP